MRTRRHHAAAARAALLGAALFGSALLGAARADEAEVMARYAAYNTAMKEGRLRDAQTEGEAAWRAAEAAWGARQETAVLAYNLARLEVVSERRAAAKEPAERALALVDQGVAGGAIARSDVLVVSLLATFDPASAKRGEIDALEEALGGYAPTDAQGRAIGWMGWTLAAMARGARGQWKAAYKMAQAQVARMEAEGAPPQVLGPLALVGVKAGVETDELKEALVLAHRAVKAYPPQPREKPIDNVLGQLLGWDAGVRNILGQRGRADEIPDLEPVRWADGRYSRTMGCDVEWIVRAPPSKYPPEALAKGQIVAMMFEYYLDADGSVIRVDPVGSVRETVGFAEATVAAMRQWRASPQPRAECRGPFFTIMSYQIDH